MEKTDFFQISRGQINITPPLKNQVLMGWGDVKNTAQTIKENLNVRMVWVKDSNQHSILFFQYDLCMISQLLRDRLLEKILNHPELKKHAFVKESFLFSASHTHSAPGGYCGEALYQLGSLGLDEDFIVLITSQTLQLILNAQNHFKSSRLICGKGEILEQSQIFHNRSLDAFLRNKEIIEKTEKEYTSLPKTFSLWRFEDAAQKPMAVISFIGLHGTCIHQDQKCIHPDHKGLSSKMTEEKYHKEDPEFIALYLQGAAGDITPNFKLHQKGDMKRGVYQDDFASVEYVSRTQSEMVEKNFELLKGQKSEDAQILIQESEVHFFKNSTTEGPALGVTFLKSTAEGKIPMTLVSFLVSFICSLFKVNEAQQKIHGVKTIAVDNVKRRLFFFHLQEKSFIHFTFFLPFYYLLKSWKKSGLIKTLPLLPEKQWISFSKIGSQYLICCPGEFTLQSGRRMVRSAELILKEVHPHEKEFSISFLGYTNGYGSYVTTSEEYELQRYEGACTLYGQHTLEMYQRALHELVYKLFGNNSIPVEKNSLKKPGDVA